ncbi:hypothetical protein AAFF_G00258510 [Aldrovandia affinis]|uniref:Uncharacterized protein n=1 Tax=Aldrovandia affinis TaxID=143900 RepID=A0AAD7ST96_9TELE|nr:hypothetical protein AAFF_G00258510 [Aldrovandia affinis]
MKILTLPFLGLSPRRHRKVEAQTQTSQWHQCIQESKALEDLKSLPTWWRKAANATSAQQKQDVPWRQTSGTGWLGIPHGCQIVLLHLPAKKVFNLPVLLHLLTER